MLVALDLEWYVIQLSMADITSATSKIFQHHSEKYLHSVLCQVFSDRFSGNHLLKLSERQDSSCSVYYSRYTHSTQTVSKNSWLSGLIYWSAGPYFEHLYSRWTNNQVKKWQWNIFNDRYHGQALNILLAPQIFQAKMLKWEFM